MREIIRRKFDVYKVLGFVLILLLVISIIFSITNRLNKNNFDLKSKAQTTLNSSNAVNQLESIINTNYSIPSSNVYFVSISGSDTANGTSINTPLRNIATAITKALTGYTIVIRSGVYKESLLITGKALTIQPYPNEQVWLEGADIVSGWGTDTNINGTIWKKTGWTSNLNFSNPTGQSEILRFGDMVFYNGILQTVVRTKDEVTTGKFYVDYVNDILYIGDNPVNISLIEATKRSNAFLIKSSGSIIRGLGIRRFGDSMQDGALKVDLTNNNILENNTVIWNAGSGMSISGTNTDKALDNIIRNNRIAYNGHLGIHGTNADRVLIDNNTISYNERKRPSVLWEAAGVKMTRTTDLKWTNNFVQGNFGAGLWTDITVISPVIVRNVVLDNLTDGIACEETYNCIVASNIVRNNGEFGIYINESNDCKVYNNSLIGNNEDIRIAEAIGSSTDPTAPNGDGDRKNPDSTTNNLVPWDTFNTVIKNNILSNVTGARLVLAEDYRDFGTIKTGPDMVSEYNYNAYFRTNSSLPTTLLHWRDPVAGVLNLRNITEIRTKTNKETNGINVDNVATNPFFVNDALGDYHLISTSPAKNAGESLPVNIANAIGVTAGVKVDMGALYWNGSSSSTPTPTLSPTTTPNITNTPTPLFTISPSKTSTPIPTLTSYKDKGDLNGDNKVDILDLSILATNWQLNNFIADANNDGKVDIIDLSIIATNWMRIFII